MESVCCLLHNLLAGGSARQWIHLLARHVADGGRATIVAPPGPLTAKAESAGIETVGFRWEDLDSDGGRVLDPLLAVHELAIVHWDHRVMDAFEPALAIAGRAALVMHQIPHAQARWLGREAIPAMRRPIALAVAAPHAVPLVRGEWHRQRFAAAFDLPAEELRILPPAIPVPSTAGATAGDPGEILALTRLSAEKTAIVELAVELTRLRIDAGLPARLAVAGKGDWRQQAIGLCESRLPADAWRIEEAPADPIARLAAADLVVAQGQTTLEAAALERRVIVARSSRDGRPAGIALTPARYGLAARDPFGRLPVGLDPRRPLEEALALEGEQLLALREMVLRFNSLEAGARALAEAIARTA